MNLVIEFLYKGKKYIIIKYGWVNVVEELVIFEEWNLCGGFYWCNDGGWDFYCLE